MKEVKVEWCEKFVIAAFTKHHAFPGPDAGIEVSYFWDMAEKAGLWERGTCGGPMSEALSRIVEVKSVCDDYGNWCYNYFKLKAG